MLGDPDDPLALEHEPPQVRELLQKYVDGEIELSEAESQIDWDLYLGEAGQKRHKEEDLRRQERDKQTREMNRLIEYDIERMRIQSKAKMHRPTPADRIRLAAASLHKC